MDFCFKSWYWAYVLRFLGQNHIKLDFMNFCPKMPFSKAKFDIILFFSIQSSISRCLGNSILIHIWACEKSWEKCHFHSVFALKMVSKCCQKQHIMLEYCSLHKKKKLELFKVPKWCFILIFIAKTEQVQKWRQKKVIY